MLATETNRSTTSSSKVTIYNRVFPLTRLARLRSQTLHSMAIRARQVFLLSGLDYLQPKFGSEQNAQKYNFTFTLDYNVHFLKCKNTDNCGKYIVIVEANSPFFILLCCWPIFSLAGGNSYLPAHFQTSYTIQCNLCESGMIGDVTNPQNQRPCVCDRLVSTH